MDNHPAREGYTAAARNLRRFASSRHWFVTRADREVAARGADDLEAALRRIFILEEILRAQGFVSEDELFALPHERGETGLTGLSAAVKKARGGEAPPPPMRGFA